MGAKVETATCSVCGGETRSQHCKIFCPNCGYTRDCSDPF